MAETTHITVIIAGRSYPLIVEKADEEVLLQTVKTINERITHYQAQFQSKDKQDCLAMALIELATLQRMESKDTESSEPLQDNQYIQEHLASLIKVADGILT